MFLLDRMQMELDRRDPYWNQQVSPFNPSNPYDWNRFREPIVPVKPVFEPPLSFRNRVWNPMTGRFE